MAAPSRNVIRRRRMVAAGVLAAAAIFAVAAIASALTGGGKSDSRPAASKPGSTAASTETEAAVPAVNPQRITPIVPGTAQVITETAKPVPQVALTFDDGFCPACVKKIVSVLEQTGAHATFFPNGQYGSSWGPVAKQVTDMVAKGQLTLGNHTFSHGVSTQIGAAATASDLQRNEDWIERTFKVTARPWFRPPYGDFNSGTLSAAGQIGYTKVVMWSGTVADSSVRSPAYIMNAIKYWAKPGRIILMHGNYPATAHVLPKIIGYLKAKGLEPVTMAELAANGTRSSSPSTGY